MTKNIQDHTLLKKVFENLPPHYYDDFSDDFVAVLATLRLHGFTITRADEGTEIVDGQDLWAELSHPSIWLSGATVSPLIDALRKSVQGSQDHTNLLNQIIRTNLLEQQRLLSLLEEFYKTHSPPFYARLVAETVELGETYIRSQRGKHPNYSGR